MKTSAFNSFIYFLNLNKIEISADNFIEILNCNKQHFGIELEVLEPTSIVYDYKYDSFVPVYNNESLLVKIVYICNYDFFCGVDTIHFIPVTRIDQQIFNEVTFNLADFIKAVNNHDIKVVNINNYQKQSRHNDYKRRVKILKNGKNSL